MAEKFVVPRGEHKKYLSLEMTQNQVTRQSKYKPKSFGQNKIFEQKKQKRKVVN